jgi:hypothetical protein
MASERKPAVLGVPNHDCWWPLMAAHQELMLTVDGICLIREGAEDEHSVYRERLCCAPQRGDEAGMMQWIWIVAFTWAALLYFAPELFQLYRRWSLARKRARALKKRLA